jgi:hypothetical protein
MLQDAATQPPIGSRRPVYIQEVLPVEGLSAALLSYAATPDGAEALRHAGWFLARPGEAEVALGDGRRVMLREMKDEALLTWLRMELASVRMVIDEPGADRKLAALLVGNVALVAMALGVSSDHAAALSSQVRRSVVEAQDRLNSTALYADALLEVTHGQPA